MAANHAFGLGWPVVVVAALVSASLLARTARAADRINHKAENIAKTGQGINTATDSVIQLTRTNETASSILASAKPLEGKLNQVIGLAQSVDGRRRPASTRRPSPSTATSPRSARA